MSRDMTATLPSPDRIASCRILVVGDVMLDRYWHGEVARISPEAPVPVVHVRREENRPGGAANVALNIQTLGARATLLSMVGADAAAQTLRALLQQHGIDAELGKAKLDLAAVWTNDFVRKANAKYPKA